MKVKPTFTDPYNIQKLAKIIEKLFPNKSYNVDIPTGSQDIEITIKGVKTN
jgi:hypothetical protein